MVKVIIAGSRSIRCGVLTMMNVVAASGFKVESLFHGGAAGVDLAADEWGAWAGIPVVRIDAPWGNTEGKPESEIGWNDGVPYWKGAGPWRNRQMAGLADALIAVWNGQSKGTQNMIQVMKSANKPVYIYEYHTGYGGHEPTGGRGYANRSD